MKSSKIHESQGGKFENAKIFISQVEYQKSVSNCKRLTYESGEVMKTSHLTDMMGREINLFVTILTLDLLCFFISISKREQTCKCLTPLSTNLPNNLRLDPRRGVS